MLSPLLLKLPDMAWKAKECFPGGDGGGCSSEDAGESFSDKGKDAGESFSDKGKVSF